ncbi:MAG: helix-turn-helix transcriptional regulator [Lachnospiraceae bacterium]|nr:helix-turn-helix transcriptional regulator [Lachnospiraceae bacterium]
MTIGEKIKKYRTFNGLTQAELGKMVGLSGDRIRQYENNVRTPKDGKLFEIADALGVNALALSEPDLDNTNSIMHILFELEEQYGLRIDKADNSYTLSFSQDDKKLDTNWLINGINDWIRKRNELQPDINDSSSTITKKKRDYIIWKARYPYHFGEQMKESQLILQEFHDRNHELLSDNHNPVNTFSEFYKYFLALTNTGLAISVIYDSNSPDDIRIQIDQDMLFNSSEDVIKTYMEFVRAFSDIQKAGMSCLSFSCKAEDDKLYVFFCFTNNQMITLLSHFKSQKEKWDSEIIDESTYEADIEDTLRMYNIPIKDYI